MTGGLLGLLRLKDEEPLRANVALVDELTEASLRFLGVRPAEAKRLASLPLPALYEP